MSLLTLDLNPPPPAKRPLILPPAARYPRILTGAINEHHFPVRGLLYSFILHEIAIGAMMFIPPVLGPRHPLWPEEHWEATMIPKGVLYLPQIGGGSEGSSPKKMPSQSPSPKAPAAVASRPGPTFAGNQEIVSNPPNPTNHIQTILQPDLPRPPVLKGYVPLPNMVLLAKALPPPPPPKPVEKPKPVPEAVQPPPPKPAETPKSAETPPVRETPFVPQVPKITLTGTQPLEAPHLTLPATPVTPTNPILSHAPTPPPPAPAPAEKVAESKPAPVVKSSEAKAPLIESKPASEPAPQRPQALPAGEALSAHNLLVLSPVPSRDNAHASIPKGEARGQFAISRHSGQDHSPQGEGAGAGTGNVTTKMTGIGSASASTEGSAIGGSGSGVGNGGGGKGSGTEGEKGGAGAGGGNGGGLGGEGSGTGKGSGSGRGTGTGHGSGSGAGAGPGAGPFAGMTIQGAEGPAGGISISGASNPSDENQSGGSYGMTIVTTGNSGGGVGDFGIFSDEAVFTVYLNPAETADDPAPPWALQYALLNPSSETLQDLLPPVAVMKKMPQWPRDVSGRYEGQQIALYAVINAKGRMGQFKVLQSPNSQLSEVLLAALEQWVFRPATMNGRPVAVKVVLGVPISPPQ
jgi:hypothetical protein